MNPTRLPARDGVPHHATRHHGETINAMTTILDAADTANTAADTAAQMSGRWTAAANITAHLVRSAVACHGIHSAGTELDEHTRDALTELATAFAEMSDLVMPALVAMPPLTLRNGTGYDEIPLQGREHADTAIEAATTAQRARAAAALRILADSDTIPEAVRTRLGWAAVNINPGPDEHLNSAVWGRGNGLAGKLRAVTDLLQALHTRYEAAA
ncbi:hypothetical protein ACIPRL_07795 [Streptomyces sp. NPDC090085]|uniref:hypothetical protein n=1 Tax=Streptomyces sp. NPDC090085 TaxID=3365943 RepID=UPI00382D5057